MRSVEISEVLIPGSSLPWPMVEQGLGCVLLDIQQIIRDRNILTTPTTIQEIFLTLSPGFVLISIFS